jgi:hypothetical protein
MSGLDDDLAKCKIILGTNPDNPEERVQMIGKITFRKSPEETYSFQSEPPYIIEARAVRMIMRCVAMESEHLTPKTLDKLNKILNTALLDAMNVSRAEYEEGKKNLGAP